MTDNHTNSPTDKRVDKPGDEPEVADSETDAAASAPRGAILITTFLTLVILVFWFGTYILSLVRG